MNISKQFVTLSVNDYVKGNLHIEHMGENHLKQMPPKFQELGKEIKVRVLGVRVDKRYVEFTKKDSLMKEDAPVFQSYKELKKGDKIVSAIVGKNEFGYIVKTFGNVKGLVSLEDIKEKHGNDFDEGSFKTGSILKAYVLFKKKDKGVALTLSKKKARAEVKDESKNDKASSKNLDSYYLPNEEQLEEILNNEKFSSLLKTSRDKDLVTKTHQFRVLEDDESKNYCIVKCVDPEKKSKAFIAILPRCLMSNNPGLSLSISESDFTCKGLILEIYKKSLPVISIQPELIYLKDDILKKEDNQAELPQSATYVGVVNGIVGKAGLLSVRFFNGV